MQGKAPHSVHGHVLREITCTFRVIEFEARSSAKPNGVVMSPSLHNVCSAR